MSQSQYYCSLDYCKEFVKTEVPTGNTLSADDKRLLIAIRTVSRRIDSVFKSRRPLFQPYIESRKVVINGFNVNSRLGTLALPSWALYIYDTLVGVNGVQVDVEAYPNVNQPPFQIIRLTDPDDDWYSPCGLTDCTSPLQAEIPAIWGYHRDYDDSAWEPVDALAATIDDVVTSFTVANAAGADASGMTPRISAGDLLWMDNDSSDPEYMEVVSVNYSTNVVTVRRGVNGTGADAHSETVAVYRWNVEDPVKTAVARQAGLIYARRGAYTTMEVQGMSEVRYPPDWLREVVDMMQEYA